MMGDAADNAHQAAERDLIDASAARVLVEEIEDTPIR